MQGRTAEDSDDDRGEEDSDWDTWSGDDGCASQSLFDARVFPSAEAAMDFDAANYGFDLRQICQEVSMFVAQSRRIVDM